MNPKPRKLNLPIIVLSFILTVHAPPTVAFAQETSGNTTPGTPSSESSSNTTTETSQETNPVNPTTPVAGPINESHGTVTVGIGGVQMDHPSLKFGQYSGLQRDGLFFAGDVDLQTTYSPYYFDLRGNDLGLEDRNITLETGWLGTDKILLNYNQIIQLNPNPSETIFNGAGGTYLSLPAGFVRGTSTSTMTIPTLNDVELEQKRKDMSAAYSKAIGDYDLTLSYRRINKDGIISLGAPIGINGGAVVTTVLPAPVDYTTDEVKSSISYTGSRGQAQFEYYLSVFKDANSAFSWQNPYLFVQEGPQFGCPFSGICYPASANPAVGLTSLPPDNQAQRFSLSGGLNFPLSTRIYGLAEYGMMTQNADLLPYSNNPTSDIVYPLPRNTSEAEIDTVHLNLDISSRPFSKLSLSLKQRFYQTENKTPYTLFLRVINDSGAGIPQTTPSSEAAEYSIPYDYSQYTTKLDATYALMKATQLKMGYTYDVMDRDYREIGITRENTYLAKLTTHYIPLTSVSLTASEGIKRSDGDYSASKLYDYLHTQAYIDTLPANMQFENSPWMRKFDIADRNRNKLGATFTWMPVTTTSIGLYYTYWTDDYVDSPIGLQSSDHRSYTLDLTYTPTEYVSTYFYFTREDLKTQQESNAFTSGSTPATSYDDPATLWGANISNMINTVGVGLSFLLIEHTLTLDFDGSFSRATEGFQFSGSALATANGVTPPTNMPDLMNQIVTLKLTGKYKVSRSVMVSLRYQYESYISTDFSTDNVPPASAVLSDVLTLSGSVPNYEAHLGVATVTYQF